MISFNIIPSYTFNVSQVVFLPSSFPLKPRKAAQAVMLLYFYFGGAHFDSHPVDQPAFDHALQEYPVAVPTFT